MLEDLKRWNPFILDIVLDDILILELIIHKDVNHIRWFRETIFNHPNDHLYKHNEIEQIISYVC